jgi:hypothetical protein
LIRDIYQHLHAQYLAEVAPQPEPDRRFMDVGPE